MRKHFVYLRRENVAMSRLRYRYCLVPNCNNSTYTSPNKHLFPVPSAPYIRRKWFKAIGPGVEYKVFKAQCFCCEDHFDLPTDSNYNKYISGKIKRLSLSKYVIPHKFECQRNFDLTKVDKATTIQADGSTQTGEDQTAPSESYVVELEYETDGSSEYEVEFSV